MIENDNFVKGKAQEVKLHYHTDVFETLRTANDNASEVIVWNYEFIQQMLANKDYNKFFQTIYYYLENWQISKDELDASVYIAFENDTERLLDFYHQAYYFSSEDFEKYERVSSLISWIVKRQISCGLSRNQDMVIKTHLWFEWIYALYKREEDFITIAWNRYNFLSTYVITFIDSLLSSYISEKRYEMITYFISSNISKLDGFNENIFHFINMMNHKRNLTFEDNAALNKVYVEVCALLHLNHEDNNLSTNLKLVV